MLALEESCPVPDSMLGNLYRASPESLQELIESIPPTVRAMLAIYCYRRLHFVPLALSIASTCGRADLAAVGGEFGIMVFAQVKEAPKVFPTRRRKVTLATIRPFAENESPPA